MRRFLIYIFIFALILIPLALSVSPVYAAGIALSTTYGIPGTTVTVTGTAFAPDETGIVVLFDGIPVTSPVTASPTGGWTAAFIVPAVASSSTHTIDARGNTTLAGDVADILFSIIPVISRNPSGGAVGTSVTVSGSGFGAGETGIRVTFDGTSVVSNISATSNGSWTGTFSVPAAISGSHTIDASGNTTAALSVGDISFTVTPSISLGKETGPPGTSIVVTGTGFAANETGINVTYDGSKVGVTVIANSKGGWSTSFDIPDSPAGPHIVDAYGVTTLATNVPDQTFTSSSGISLTDASGSPGSSITISGSGFYPDESGIVVTFDGSKLVTNIKASPAGSFKTTITVPESPGGDHVIDAYGSITQASVIPDVTFIVIPGISIYPPGGPPGTTVTVTGSGFAPSENNITVTFDNATVAYAIAANEQGAWTITFVVPASSAGSHVIDANGPISEASDVSDGVFTTGAGISLNKQSGSPGTSIIVSGFGFAINEKGITVNFDGKAVLSNITANAQGAWSAIFIVPTSLAGSHTISAFGANTTETIISPVTFNIASGIDLNPTSGNVGLSVTITGSGFTPNMLLKIKYDDQELIGSGTKADSAGGMQQTITIPKSKAGAHVITVIDQENNESKAYFNVENVPPSSPRLLSPEDGSRAGLLKGYQVTFRWREVTDPSGVSYILQINDEPDFTKPILEKTDFLGTTFTPASADTLSDNDYYWRVKAVDGASNESEWSETWVVKSGFIALWALILIILVVFAAIGGLAYFLVVRHRTKMMEAISVPEEFEVAGQWWTIEPQGMPKPRALPLSPRLALPQATKGPKTLSPEQQARIKVIANFAQSLPLAEPNYTADWLLDILEINTGSTPSPSVRKQLLDGNINVRYDPTWKNHPLYYEMTELFKDRPILQSLNGFIELVNQCASEASGLIHDIYRDATVEIPSDLLGTNDWDFVVAVYSDCMSWFLGKSLREPSDRDYVIKSSSSNTEGTDTLWLWGADSTSFAVPLISARDEDKITQYRSVHLKLRRMYRTNARAKQIVGMIAQSEVQRSRLFDSFNQFASVMQ